MALKIGKLEIGYRLLISLTVIAIAYGWIGTQLCTLLRVGDYLVVGLLFVLSVVAIFAIPQSLGGLLAAIAAVITIYWQSSDITYSLITACVCLAMYLIGFQDVRYDAAPEKKLSILEVIATLITIGFMVQTSLLVLLNAISWVTSAAIGALAGAITLIGKQLSYTDFPQKTIWIIFGSVTFSSLAIGFVVRLILYAMVKETPLY
ncbi:hypothetical protein [Pseudanabaena minima]|uniref:hypothetical protein n=1 Tax=Pseudanabaena minima TaxID=890415 RepID=UPI003DA8F489